MPQRCHKGGKNAGLEWAKVLERRSDDDLRHDARREELLGLHLPMRDPLLMRVERHLFPRRPILLNPIEKQVAEHVAHPARVGGEPRHWITRDRWIEDALDGAPLRFEKRVVEIARGPWMLVEDGAPH